MASSEKNTDGDDGSHDKTHHLTELLRRASNGDAKALQELTPIVYPEFMKFAHEWMKQERVGHTLQRTGLAHEAWIRIIRQPNTMKKGRQYFFASVSEIIRRILVDYARERKAKKRQRDRQTDLDTAELTEDRQCTEILAVHEALEKLARINERQAKVVAMRYFSGMTDKEIAEDLDVSVRTVTSDWQFAKAWLVRELASEK